MSMYVLLVKHVSNGRCPCVQELAGVSEVSAINASTINPARVLKIDHKKGRIRANYDADLVVLDRDYTVLETFVLGESVYKR